MWPGRDVKKEEWATLKRELGWGVIKGWQDFIEIENTKRSDCLPPSWNPSHPAHYNEVSICTVTAPAQTPDCCSQLCPPAAQRQTHLKAMPVSSISALNRGPLSLFLDKREISESMLTYRSLKNAPNCGCCIFKLNSNNKLFQTSDVQAVG